MEWMMGGSRMHGIKENEGVDDIDKRAMCGLIVYNPSIFELKDPSHKEVDLCKSCIKIDKKANAPIVEEYIAWQSGLN
jgi:hypothetical protein